MPIQVQGNSGILAEVGGATFKGVHAHLKPLEYGALGHYRTSVRVVLSAAQAAASRLFELRNTGSNLIVPTRIEVTTLPVGSVDTPYLAVISLFKCTGFTAVDTTNTTTPPVSVMRTSGMSGAPGAAAVRYLTASGAAAGMTGGTLTKESLPMASLMAWMASAAPTSMPVTKQWGRLTSDEHPPVFVNNEGFEIENVNLGSATYNAIQVLIEVSWAEVTAY